MQEYPTSLHNYFSEVPGRAVSGVAGKGLQRCLTNHGNDDLAILGP